MNGTLFDVAHRRLELSSALYELGSVAYQQEYWVGGKGALTIDAAFDLIVGDLEFGTDKDSEALLEYLSIGPEQLAFGMELGRVMLSVLNATDKRPVSLEVLSAPQWPEIVALARRLFISLNT